MSAVNTVGKPKFEKPTFLMCPPDFYDVRYVINPWMEGNISRSSRALAVTQWERLHAALVQFADVLLAEPDRGSPDMVFAANAGLVHQGRVVMSRFLHPERQGEEEHFRGWFAQAGFTLDEMPEQPETPFEGEGDALFTANGERLWAGYGWRTSLASHDRLRALWGCEVASLLLVDPRFYHLDTCFCPLANGNVMYFPAAFDAGSIAAIEAFYAPEQRIAIGEQDAVRFACNAVNAGRAIVLNEISGELRERLERRGFDVVETPLSEFMKAGGAAKCLVLRLSELDVTHCGVREHEVASQARVAVVPVSYQPDEAPGHQVARNQPKGCSSDRLGPVKSFAPSSVMYISSSRRSPN